MTSFRVVLARLKGLFGKRRLEANLDEEIQTHLELLVRENLERGMSPMEARLAARRAFGAIEPMKDSYRDQRGLPFVDALAQDLRYALRQLRRSPAFAAAAILTLALGIGANMAIFRVLDAVVLRSLPVRDPDRLVLVNLKQNGKPISFSYPLFHEMAAQQRVFEGMFAVADLELREAVLRGGGTVAQVKGRLVTGGYFRVLGVGVTLGRVFTDADDRPGAPGLAVISDRLWEREFGRSPAVIGRSLKLNRSFVTIVGVAPPQFFGEQPGDAPDLWVPLSLQPQLAPTDWVNAPFYAWLEVMARLKPGVTAAQARQALTPLYAELHELNIHPAAGKVRYNVDLEPGSQGIRNLQEHFSRPLWVLMGSVGFVLLIACSNIANLLLARAAARSREMRIRLALGAGRSRLVRQLLTESAVLAAAGTAVGIGIAIVGSPALVSLASTGAPWRIPLDLGSRVIGFTALIAVCATGLFGLAPALVATQGNRGGRPRQRIARGLVVLQVAASLTLLIGAALLVRSLWNLRYQDLGFRREGVLLVKVPVEFGPGMITRNLKLAGPLYERLNALPGVRSAAIASLGPLADFQQTAPIALPERPSREGEYVRIVHVSPRFFETMGIRVQAGRAITAADRSGAPKIGVLSETAVKELFRGGNPLGRLISMTRRYDPAAAIEVVGVAHDIRYSSMREPFGMLIYVPLDQSPAPITSLALHVDGDPARYVAPVVAVVHELDSGLKLGDMLPVGQVADSTLGQERMLAFLSACFGLLAVTLASVGLYGVVSYAVAHRTPEIGIRMALGASRGGVTALLMKDVLGLLAAGITVGGAASVATTYWIRSLLFGLNPGDPGMWLGAAALLGVVAVISGAIPATRAARLDPMDALRLE